MNAIMANDQGTRRRNRGYEDTHKALIETAVRLISEQGASALSIAELARATGIDRTSVYYHFKTREELLRAVRDWSSEQLTAAFTGPGSQDERIDHITRFVLENPELIRLWTDDFLAGADIRESYPLWDSLVESIRQKVTDSEIDAEIFCTMLITGSVIGPGIFRKAVRPDASNADIIERFRREQQRLLRTLDL